ncbi:cysteine-rich CWC family protein [Paenibacillus doosanensis]|uniref:cysteine-rich CWC family protein n=1 Tax=Paenibacillus doosanensis TaxID=1229154 RepID=UPI00217F94D5|nr:cysteine-rich CWC family protein [Paenibacillus doosanensis]MCS7459834.1 cysteine-rich CWC family protein [Paenibacillus doosanensis]
MNNDTTGVDERRCPICNGPNHCEAKQGDCWCFRAAIPRELRDRVPEPLRGKVCICRNCAESFQTGKQL